MELHASSNAHKKEIGLSFAVSKIGLIIVAFLVFAFFAGKYLVGMKFGSAAPTVSGSAELDPHLLDAQSQSGTSQSVIYGAAEPVPSTPSSSASAKVTKPLSPTPTEIPVATAEPTATKTPAPTAVPTSVPAPTSQPTTEPSSTPIPPTPTPSV